MRKISNHNIVSGGNKSDSNKSDTQQASDLFDKYRLESSSERAMPLLFDDEPLIVSKNKPGVGDDDNQAKNTHRDTPRNNTQDVGTSALPTGAKHALVSLMRLGAVIASQKPVLFEEICRFEKHIEQQLSNMYLRLLLDVSAGVALVLQQEVMGDGDDDEDTLLRLISRRTLSLYDTLLLLVLRKFYQERETSGEQKIIVDVERIETYLTPFLPLTNSSRAEKRALNPALKKMVDRKILTVIRGDEGRYEITPVIRYVVNANFLEQLLKEYTTLAGELGLDANEPSDSDTDTGNEPLNDVREGIH